MPVITHVVGARPNFMKVAPVLRALAAVPGVVQRLVHTGQHYDAAMSDVFFEQLGLPQPDTNLHVGSGSHAHQTAEIMKRFDGVLDAERPAWVLVYGDVNSTLAATLVSVKRGVRVAHVEAGLRSFDRAMPEEINRLMTDQVADLLFTPSRDADAHLLREGIAPEKIHFVGNVMIDTLVRMRPLAEAAWSDLAARFGLASGGYVLVTLHRPSNVDDPARLRAYLDVLARAAERLPVVFPVHPRTRTLMTQHGWLDVPGVALVPPVTYLDAIALQQHARLVVTDSGGMQEETTYLGVPCLTVRATTERPVTITEGTNRLVQPEPAHLEPILVDALAAPPAPARRPELGDGHAGDRIAAVLATTL